MQSTKKLELNSIHFVKTPKQYFVEGFYKEALICSQIKDILGPVFIISSSEAEIKNLSKNLQFLIPNCNIHTYLEDKQKPFKILNFLKLSLNGKKEDIFLLSTNNLNVAPPIKEYHFRQTLLKKSYVFLESVEHFMTDNGYKSTLMVEEPGQFSIKSGVLDFFSPQNDKPSRCELFGDEIISLFNFDIQTQINTQAVEQIPLWNLKNANTAKESLLQYIPAGSCILNFSLSDEIYKDLYKSKIENNIFYFNQKHFDQELLVDIGPSGKSLKTFIQKLKQKNLFEKKIYLKEQIKKWNNKNIQIILSSSKHSQSIEIKNLFLDLNLDFSIKEIEFVNEIKNENIYLIQKPISESFFLEKENWILLNAKEILNKKVITENHSKSHSQIRNQISSISLDSLNIGDLVSHIQHGIGRYLGLKFINISNQEMEFINLEYKNKEQLYIPIYKINAIKKYIGNTNILDKLGNNKWNNAKSQVKKHLQDISLELLELYAERKNLHRPAFAELGSLYKKVKDSFPYTETKDQNLAILDILKDFEKTLPMDRLICGDVGFGKTEVAVRACARTIENKKQIAILVPTTVLSFQHHKHFKQRLGQFGVKIEALNRFVPMKKQKQIIDDLKTASLDIVIGTHKLLSSQIEYKKLGLLIIDEEQKFGVKHKEKLKQIRKSIDTLTLSATPIPRTLNFSLLGLKDINLIQSPPKNRLSIRTFINSYNKKIIKEAIENEIKRDGQVFFLHNKIKNIELISQEIKDLVPNIKVAFAHGQMLENQLEQQMLNFSEKKIDVLVCTSIIESGLDIPNANTLIINNAHLFGLSQLYQIRGRVGRSSNRAYCFLLIPPHAKIDEKSLERLHSIRDNTKLGSGIQIAQKDLELRGAGDLLGQEQSGTINSIGYELYLDLLEDAINKAKSIKDGDKKYTVADIEPDINLPYACLIPQNYISDIRTRLYYYKKISNIKSIHDIDALDAELRTEFSKTPKEIYNLMGLILIKNFAKKAGIVSVSLRAESLNIKIANNTLYIDYLIQKIKQEPKKYQLKQNSLIKIQIKNTNWEELYKHLQMLLPQIATDNN